MKRLSRLAVVALVVAGLQPACLRASELFAPAPIDEVSVRTLPAFTALETDTTGSLDTAWERGFRLGARFAARANSGLNTPTVITLPDWEKAPNLTSDKLHVLVQCLLDPRPDYPTVRDREAMLRDMPGMTVACYAQRGNYSAAALLAGLQKIQAFLKSRNIREVGPPRYLYYTTTNWMPSWWKTGEVQVPIGSRPAG